MPKICCCAPNIDASKNQIIAAIQAGNIKQAGAMPPFQRTQNDTEEIARRTADELNRILDPYQRDTQRQLDAIVNALIALKARPDPTALLNQILRNQNDLFDLQRENTRQLQFGIDKLATREQAKDLLSAIASLRADMLQQFKFAAREQATRFAALGAAIVALGVAQRVAFLAEISAKVAQTATILRAIAALKLSKPDTGLADILEKLAELFENQLSLEAVDGSVPVCVIDSNGIATIQPQPFQGYALSDGNGASTADYQKSVNDMLYALLATGQIACKSNVQSGMELLLEIDGGGTTSTVPKVLYPSAVIAEYFTIELTEVNPKYLRAYKLAGDQSEYGAGNIALVDSVGRVLGDFLRVFNKKQRVDIPEGVEGCGIRVSLKSGVSAAITAHGVVIQ